VIQSTPFFKKVSFSFEARDLRFFPSRFPATFLRKRVSHIRMPGIFQLPMQRTRARRIGDYARVTASVL